MTAAVTICPIETFLFRKIKKYRKRYNTSLFLTSRVSRKNKKQIIKNQPTIRVYLLAYRPNFDTCLPTHNCWESTLGR